MAGKGKPLYHMTPHRNLESIFRTGLLPAHGNFVCLCEDPLSWYWDYARLAVDIDAFRRDNPGVRVTTWLPDLDEVCVWGTIPPKYIRLCSGGSGSPRRPWRRLSGLEAVRPSPRQKSGGSDGAASGILKKEVT